MLLPVFALGNAQELLLILDEYWSQNEDLQNVNVLCVQFGKKCMAVYETYTGIMNDKIRLSSASSEKSNPFDFKYIKSIKDLSKFRTWDLLLWLLHQVCCRQGFQDNC